MNNAERELLKFVNQHPEYREEYGKGNLTINLFSDIMRKEPREIIAVSDLPHDLDLIGAKLARSWEIKEQRENTLHGRLDKAKERVKSQNSRQEHSKNHSRGDCL